MRIKKRCGNCARCFVNRKGVKWCADKYKDKDGNVRVKLREEIGAMGDIYHTCEEWTPDDSVIRQMEEDKRDRKSRRLARAAKEN